MIRRQGNCSWKLTTCIRGRRVGNVIEGVHPPHRVMVLGEVGTIHIIVGLELHLVSPTQLLRAGTDWIRVEINERKGLPTMAWETM